MCQAANRLKNQAVRPTLAAGSSKRGAMGWIYKVLYLGVTTAAGYARINGVGGYAMGEEERASRRPIASRSSSWAIGLSAWLARSGATPNGISLLSVVFAGVGAAL